MSLNLLITPNVIINCLLIYEQEHQTPTYIDLLNKIISLSIVKDYSIFMTKMDLEVVIYYYNCFKQLLYERIDNNNYTNSNNLQETFTTFKLLSTLNSVRNYIDIAQAYPVDEDILNLATRFLINNPSDALRFATAIAGEMFLKPVSISAIITWEPSHFCQDPNNYFAIRRSGYGKIKAIIRSNFHDNIDLGISKRIYTPSHFIFSRFVTNNQLVIDPIFHLIHISIRSEINSQKNKSSSIAKVIIEYNDQLYSYEYSCDSGAISALFLAIYICVKRKCLKNDSCKKKLIKKKLIKKMILSVSPVRGDNNEIHSDIVISDQDIQATKRGYNLLCATGEAYIEILNHVVNQSSTTSHV